MQVTDSWNKGLQRRESGKTVLYPQLVIGKTTVRRSGATVWRFGAWWFFCWRVSWAACRVVCNLVVYCVVVLLVEMERMATIYWWPRGVTSGFVFLDACIYFWIFLRGEKIGATIFQGRNGCSPLCFCYSFSISSVVDVFWHFLWISLRNLGRYSQHLIFFNTYERTN
jgi:hypothetical protein